MDRHSCRTQEAGGSGRYQQSCRRFGMGSVLCPGHLPQSFSAGPEKSSVSKPTAKSEQRERVLSLAFAITAGDTGGSTTEQHKWPWKEGKRMRNFDKVISHPTGQTKRHRHSLPNAICFTYDGYTPIYSWFVLAQSPVTPAA